MRGRLLHVGWRSESRHRGKIEPLRALAGRDDGAAIACVLAALGREDFETDNETARAAVGAWLLVQIHRELRAVRKALTTPEK